MQTSLGVVEVTKEFAEKLEVRRLKDDRASGFQRKLDTRRIVNMSNDLSNGSVCPPILVGNLHGKYLVLDGQHRLEAWKISPKKFTLEAKVIKIEDINQAKKWFVDLNSNQKRVGLRHRLEVDPGEYAYRLRKLAEKYKITVTDVNSLMVGIRGVWKFYAEMNFTNKEWDMADTILGYWSKDKRWGKVTNYYSRPAVLRLVGKIACRSKDPIGAMKELQTMDFKPTSRLARVYGGSSTSVRMMENLVYEHIATGLIK